uniref:Uncharacterized protein n=1 Tax=Oryza barthii TaxID=65489 RepID=A0A0D3HAI7_9ORYZ
MASSPTTIATTDDDGGWRRRAGSTVAVPRVCKSTTARPQAHKICCRRASGDFEHVADPLLWDHWAQVTSTTSVVASIDDHSGRSRHDDGSGSGVTAATY